MYKICHTEESLRRQREPEAGFPGAMGKQPYEKIAHTLSDCSDIALKSWTGM